MSDARDPGDDVVEYLARLLVEVAQRHGIEFAKTVETEIAPEYRERVRQELGGQSPYIPRAGWFNREQRDAEIRAAKSRGRSYGWLAMRYGLARSTLHKICDQADVET